MRIKYTSIPNVTGSNSTAPWVGPGLAERLKKEAINEREPNVREPNVKEQNKEKKTKSERALEWLRRNR